MVKNKKYIIIAAVVLLLILLASKWNKLAAAVAPDSELGLTSKRDFRGKTDYPIGLRQNNPGNLIQTRPRQGWIGATQTPPSRFEEFEFYVLGVRAALKLTRNKIASGRDTIERLIRSWAPDHENDTEAYIRFVATAVGIPSNRVIATSDKEKLFKLIKAIEQFENGTTVLTRAEFDEAWTLL